jgi:hypothetical protein
MLNLSRDPITFSYITLSRPCGSQKLLMSARDTQVIDSIGIPNTVVIRVYAIKLILLLQQLLGVVAS